MASRIQISNFTYVETGKRINLRFSLALQIECLNGSHLEFCADGCMAYYRRIDNRIVWTMPLTKYYQGKTVRQSFWVNPTMYDLVYDALKEHPELLNKLVPASGKLISLLKVEDYDKSIPKLVERSV